MPQTNLSCVRVPTCTSTCALPSVRGGGSVNLDLRHDLPLDEIENGRRRAGPGHVCDSRLQDHRRRRSISLGAVLPHGEAGPRTHAAHRLGVGRRGRSAPDPRLDSSATRQNRRASIARQLLQHGPEVEPDRAQGGDRKAARHADRGADGSRGMGREQAARVREAASSQPRPQNATRPFAICSSNTCRTIRK